ncbi:ATP-binding protein [Sphingomonas sp. BK235]|uniref:hybrid sensor histidine kinase/response regulator n=1 Tax=Sphingomonas sp. BK235 TaxID=2512131 RepID=UPI00104EB5BA|nr:ATP-binding protein [Sphingomonas sp. BK235]TCP34770.1 PAS domain S-box-containing protein [Sphingomonas sp. BK235]
MSAEERPAPPSARRFLLIAAMVPLSIVALMAWTDAEYARSERLYAAALRSFDRERDQLSLLSALKDAETAQRGYLLTGDAAYLGPLSPARATAARLQRIPGVATAEIAALVEAKFAELDRTLALARAGDRTAARAAVAAGEGRRLMDRLRAAVARARHTSRAQVTAQRIAFAERRAELRRLLQASGVLLTIALAVTLRSLWQSRRAAYDGALAAYEGAERNAAVLRSTSDALMILNPSGTIEQVNAAAAELIGAPAAELERRDVATVLELAEGSGDFHRRIGLRDGRLARSFLPGRRVRRRDGSEVSVDVAIGVMRVPSGDHLVLSLRDVSERARVERAKDELISTVSHELRTPLTSVVGALALLRGGTVEELSPQAARLVDIADGNARRLIRLINDMLDIDRIESGQLAMARVPLDLRAVAADAVRDGEGLARSRGITLVPAPGPVPLTVAGDAGRLLQVVTNLLSNAVHASPPGSEIRLVTAALEGRARLCVEDRGGGIPDSLRERLFERFQSHRTPGQAVGTGLGLAIAREIVWRHDGAIWFEDRDGGGTRFVIELPLAAASAVEAAPAMAGDRPLVLHVDDDPDVRETVAAALAETARVIAAPSLDRARALLRERAPALAILDMQVVDGHGPELIPDLIDAEGAPIPVIIFSGQQIPAPLAARADVVLTKGRHSLPDLAATARRLLATRATTAPPTVGPKA